MNKNTKIKIFLASSKELKHERLIVGDALMDIMNKQNLAVQLNKWEYLDNGITDNQAEYDEKLKRCDLTIVLFWKKLGIYTKHEYQLAMAEMKDKVFIFIKDYDIEDREEQLQVFIENLDRRGDIRKMTYKSDKELYDGIVKIFECN